MASGFLRAGGDQVKAVRWHARGDLRYEDVELRKPAPGEVVIKVHFCGICGTDLEEYRSGPLTIPTQPHPLSGRQAPLTLGHEVVGEVARAAADGTGPPVGTRVVPDVVNGCGRCWWCERHQEGLCPRLAVPGQQDDGGLAEYMIARARTCVVVPNGLDPRVAVLAEPAAVAWRALDKLTSVADTRIAVIGGGTIGQLVAQMAVTLGAERCWLVDPSPFRRAFAAEHAPIAVRTPDELAGIGSEVAEPGIDAVIEASGAPGQVPNALNLVRPGGTVVAVGLRDAREPVDLPSFILGERTLMGSAAHLWDVDVSRALELLARDSVATEGFVTHEFELSQTCSQAIPMLGEPSEDVLKVIVKCTT